MPYAAELIDAVMRATGLSQAALAKHLDVAAPQVSKWRHGATPIPEERLNQLLEMGHFDEAAREYFTLGVMRDAVTTTGVMRALDGVLDRLRPALARVGILVVVSLGALAPYQQASATTTQAEPLNPLCIMRSLARWLRAAATRYAARWTHGTPAVLA